jgi:transposase
LSMNGLEQLWRERINWVQASGLTIAAASAEPGVSAASVYRWKKLLDAERGSCRQRTPKLIRKRPRSGRRRGRKNMLCLRLGKASHR